MDEKQREETLPGLCPECQGAQVVMVSYEGSIGREGRWGTHHVSGLYAVVCTQCGRTGFYAKELEEVRQEVKKYPQDFQMMAQHFRAQKKNLP